MPQNKILIFKQREQPHKTGEARCMSCAHQWIAVAPIGVTWMECPACSAEKGYFIYPCLRDGNHWTCNCGNDLFQITQEGTYCPNCGNWQQVT